MIVYRVDEADTRIHQRESKEITEGSVLFESGHRVPCKAKSYNYFKSEAEALRHMLHWHGGNVISKIADLETAERWLSEVRALQEEVSS